MTTTTTMTEEIGHLLLDQTPNGNPGHTHHGAPPHGTPGPELFHAGVGLTPDAGRKPGRGGLTPTGSC